MNDINEDEYDDLPEAKLDKAGLTALIEMVLDTELRDALRVVLKHSPDRSIAEDRNMTTWCPFGDDEISQGIVFGIACW